MLRNPWRGRREELSPEELQAGRGSNKRGLERLLRARRTDGVGKYKIRAERVVVPKRKNVLKNPPVGL